jgi:hypothetical protein
MPRPDCNRHKSKVGDAHDQTVTSDLGYAAGKNFQDNRNADSPRCDSVLFQMGA